MDLHASDCRAAAFAARDRFRNNSLFLCLDAKLSEMISDTAEAGKLYVEIDINDLRSQYAKYLSDHWFSVFMDMLYDDLLKAGFGVSECHDSKEWTWQIDFRACL